MLINRAKSAVEQATNLHIYRHLPFGVSLRYDLATTVATLSIRTVFDVGANTGQSVEEFAKDYPQAVIHSFEPVAPTFAQLQVTAAAYPQATLHDYALGEVEETLRIALEENSELNGIRNAVDDADPNGHEIRVRRLDDVCRELSISEIDLLKIDTEGHDLAVLRGAEPLLREGRVAVIKVEASLTRVSAHHILFQDFVDYLEPMGYLLFGIYNQNQRWRERRLEFCNPVFLHSKHAKPYEA